MKNIGFEMHLGPDFLCIGAQRSGTTWLYENLKSHPEFDMPPYKEIHYFNKMRERELGVGSIFSRKKRMLLGSRIRDNFLSPSFRKVSWDLRYLFYTRTENWYESLFITSPGRFSGDISPAYSTLDAAVVKYIKVILPLTKVIYIMRNPITRAWSHAKMDFERFSKRNIISIGFEEFVSHFESAPSLLRTDYARTLEIWERFFARENVFIGFFDDIVDRPKDFLREICCFLGASPKNVDNLPFVDVQFNKSTVYEAPSEIRRYLTDKYKDSILDLSKRFGERVTRWLRDA